MTFQQLTYVVEISKCGSINKAAHKLFLSQSGISTAVRELEEELGIKFIVRSNRRGVHAGGQGVSGLCSLAAGAEAADRKAVRRIPQHHCTGAFQRFHPAVSHY